MNRLEKLLQKIQEKDRLFIEKALLLLNMRKFEELDRKKLKGYGFIYRIKVRNYRIIYFDDGEEINIKAVRKRDESTYRDF